MPSMDSSRFTGVYKYTDTQPHPSPSHYFIISGRPDALHGVNLLSCGGTGGFDKSDEVYKNFSSGLLNFVNHYCSDDHSSHFCDHDKVTQNNIREVSQPTNLCRSMRMRHPIDYQWMFLVLQ